MQKRALGKQREAQAESFLLDKGLKTLERNFTCRFGEIDLIMQDDECLVFTEVRYRARNNYGSGAETVTGTKQRRIIKAASLYLMLHPHKAQQPCRFDVISIGMTDGTLDLDWIKDAFTADQSHY
jgi:putative endonuclease